jgi:hypothetical protein
MTRYHERTFEDLALHGGWLTVTVEGRYDWESGNSDVGFCDGYYLDRVDVVGASFSDGGDERPVAPAAARDMITPDQWVRIESQMEEEAAEFS